MFDTIFRGSDRTTAVVTSKEHCANKETQHPMALAAVSPSCRTLILQQKLVCASRDSITTGTTFLHVRKSVAVLVLAAAVP